MQGRDYIVRIRAMKGKFKTAIYADNRRAFFDYQILDTYEAGIELFGFEVKAVKNGKANLTGGYCAFHGKELFLLNAKIFPLQKKNIPAEYNEERSRRLLLKKSELAEIARKTQAQRLTIIPLKLYNKKGLIKVEIGLAKGLKKYEKREKIKKREAEREIQRAMRDL